MRLDDAGFDHAGFDDAVARVYWARLEDRHDGLLALLDAVERERHARYRRPADADRFLLGAAMVRALAGARLGCPPAAVTVDRRCDDCGKPHGKPRLPGAGLEVSVSHSGDLVGVACHPGAAVGLDVEQLDHRFDVDGLAATVLAPQEIASLAATAPADRLAGFLRYWTRKEALVKATGDGLRADLRSLVVTGPAEPPAVLASGHGELTLYDLTAAPGHLGALAMLRAAPVRVEELPATGLLRSTR
ncbi:MAG: 4'-phosphopantetheinyl transferase superfamily protein [Micromonosporaceae bacterium]|nr:4'-phosphopantetheinyl transferase superfamily protein [Micromonosporaceae bacterium]